MELEGFPNNNKESFPSHREVLTYIYNVADSYMLRKYIKVKEQPFEFYWDGWNFLYILTVYYTMKVLEQ